MKTKMLAIMTDLIAHPNDEKRWGRLLKPYIVNEITLPHEGEPVQTKPSVILKEDVKELVLAAIFVGMRRNTSKVPLFKDEGPVLLTR